MTLRSVFLPALFLACAAQAEVPEVVTDIAAVQSLTAQVMGDLGTPRALMERGASPHNYALRPSDAKALQAADVVFWTGPELAPWLGDVIHTLAPNAQSVMLSEADGVTRLPFREGATFERHAHEDHEAEEDHEDHDHDHDDHAEETHAHDPHLWLDPMNGRAWLAAIAETLAAQDPENAATYRANASAAQTRIDALMAEVTADLAPVKDMRFIVFHDAYQYFENRFDVTAVGAISLSDAAMPSPARVREVQSLIADHAVTCVFSEPQFNAGLVDTVLNGTAAKTTVIDPLGVTIAPGAEYYPALIESIATAFAECR